MALRKRRSLADIQHDYENGDKEPLEKLMRAWKGIKELPWDDPNSFFMIAGFHGEPFRGEGTTDPTWWGGYCEHSTVLFPTWHRAYLHRLERALQSVPGCEDVMMPFWDETSQGSLDNGIPAALTWETFELDGERIPNPLKSFALPMDIVDHAPGEGEPVYTKPLGYETVRYPLSGLVGTPADQEATKAHNAQYPDYWANVGLLNENITDWLTHPMTINGKQRGLVHGQFLACLEAETYTLFSNKASQDAYNAKNPHSPVTALESPHNSIHLAIGGFDIPAYHASPRPGANGDMGENETAAMDPIFYFHHCFIDYVFWTWQRRHGATQEIAIEAGDPGANSGANPPAYRKKNEPLTVDSALHPFKHEDGTPMTTRSVTDITGLGYEYDKGSLDEQADSSRDLTAEAPTAERVVRVAGIDRNSIRGSFVISAWVEVDGQMQALGHEAVLSRWHVAGCANCQNHLEAQGHFPLTDAGTRHLADGGGEDAVHVQVLTREGPLGDGVAKGVRLAAHAGAPFTVEIL